MSWDLAAYRAAVVACRACHGNKSIGGEWLLPAPRHGLGPSVAPVELMVVGQNPPAAAERCLHGGWMFHYQGPEWEARKERHERQMAELLTAVGSTPKNTWVTQAVKCPTVKNQLPYHGTLEACARRFLTVEYEALQPRAVLLVGGVAQQAFLEVTDRRWFHPEEPPAPVNPQSGMTDLNGPEDFLPIPTFEGVKIRYYVTRYANVVKIPHVSNAWRFFSLDDLTRAAALALARAKTHRGLLTKRQFAAWQEQHGIRP